MALWSWSNAESAVCMINIWLALRQAIDCDARLHCALVCGANSCPALRFYDENNVDDALDAAAHSFCEAETSVNVETNTVTTSKIFMWYQNDFGQSQEECLRWIARHLGETKR